MNTYYEKNKRIVTKESLDIYDLDDDQSDLEWLEKKDIVWKTVNEMDDPCYTILSLCYWEHKSMVEIAEKMNYGSEQYARNKKSSCRKYLIEKLRKIFTLDK
jgi:DNA-directed RNA polymerase specialized sigma24 family protein